jgi:hypothetical protein
MKINITLINILSLVFFITSCTENYEKSSEAENRRTNKSFKQLNLTILLDLSDRISVKKNPTQAQKDVALIMNVVDNFQKFLSFKGVVLSRDRIKLIYYPIVNFPQVSDVTDSLNIRFDDLELTERKRIYNGLRQTYQKNLEKLYSIFSNLPEYNGSDLFNYFNHRIVDDCIEENEEYINVLVILTDGYLYSYNSKIRKDNRFSYIGPIATHLTQFRNVTEWEKTFEENDYGFIKINNDLSNLKVIAAEFNPESDYPIDFDIMKKYWSKWFEEQKVNKSDYIILRTDHISQNKNVVDDFFKKRIFSSAIK